MKLGIVAGNGDLPLQLISRCIERNIDFHVLPISGQPDIDRFAPYPHDRVRPGGGGTIRRLLRQHNVTDLVMIGAIRKPNLWQFMPDFFTWRLLPKLLAAWRGDDSLLSAVVRIIEKYGNVKVRGVHEFMPELLAGSGVMGAHTPSPEALRAIDTGIKAARELGQADIGQAVIADADNILAHEGRNGTAAMLRDYKGSAVTAVLVKLCKPQQELRVDLPTIGCKTVQSAMLAGLKGIAVSAGKTLIVDKAATIAAADAAGLFLIGVDA